MVQTGMQTVIGYFENRSQAEQAIAQLMDAGFRPDTVGLAARSTSERSARSVLDRVSGFFRGSDAAREGADMAEESRLYAEHEYDSDSLRESLGALGISEDRAKYFEHRLDQGKEGVLLTLRAEGREREAEQIIQQNGGDTGESAANYQYPAATAEVSGAQPRTIQLLGEVLRVHKERVGLGEVKLRKEVVTENQTVQVPVTHEELIIERHPVGKRLQAPRLAKPPRCAFHSAKSVSPLRNGQRFARRLRSERER